MTMQRRESDVSSSLPTPPPHTHSSGLGRSHATGALSEGKGCLLFANA